MKRNEMVAVILGGGSVLHNGRLITSVDNLPSHAELAHTEEEKAAAADDLDKQIAELIQRRAALPGATANTSAFQPDPKAIASNTKLEKGEGETSETGDYPEGFPTRAKSVFEKLGKTYAEVSCMSREDLIGVNGIAETTADEILAVANKK